jgi:hypothetical protein
MAMNPLRQTFAAASSGAQTALGIDWRENGATGFTYEVQYNSGASGSVTVETTLDDVNDPSITADWIAETGAITSDTRGVIGHPVQYVRLNISSLTGGTLTFKVLVGSQTGDGTGLIPSGGGGTLDNINLAQVGGTSVVTGGVSGLLGVGGNVASGATDSGNPVKVGGVFITGLPALTTGQRANANIDGRGNLRVANVLTPSGGSDAFSNGSVGFSLDRDSGASSALLVGQAPYVYNGTSWDRARGDTSGAYVRSNFAFNAATTITRPANTTTYSAGDVVGGAITFANMGTSGGRIMLTSSQLELDIAAIPVGMTSFFVALYSVTPPSALADNAAWDLPSGDRASFLGIVQLGTPVDLGSTLYVEQNIINKQIKLAGTSAFGYLVTATGYTPAANSEVYVCSLHSVGVSL